MPAKRASHCRTGTDAYEAQDGQHLETVLERHDAFDVGRQDDENHHMADTVEEQRQVEVLNWRLRRDGECHQQDIQGDASYANESQ